MKTISTALKAHYALGTTTLASCWLTARTDGAISGFTDHDQDITFDFETWLAGKSLPIPSGILGSGSFTYAASSGYTPSDVATKSDLAVDDLEIQGFLTSPSITEDDLRAGLWDFATVVHFEVNWADLTQGALVKRCGTIGEVTVERDTFKAELRGLMQPYTRMLGELTNPGCRAILGDSRCKKDLTSFTFTGTITGVNPDGVTLYDTSRAEAGPTGGVPITGITNANPGRVTVADASTLSNGEAIVIHGVVGPAMLNAITIVRNLDLSSNRFDLGIDTSDTGTYPAYVSGGTVTPLGGDSGYFDHGKITWNTGNNVVGSTELSMEIKNSVPEQFTLMLPMPYAVQIGDTYTIVAGCDLSLTTCRVKFSNAANMRAEPFLPGIDRITQVGKGK